MWSLFYSWVCHFVLVDIDDLRNCLNDAVSWRFKWFSRSEDPVQIVQMSSIHSRNHRPVILNNYFASSDPHHGIQFIPSDILSGIPIWHCIWHVFWHSIWHIFWHSVCHIFWHSIWNIFWHSIWHIYLSGILSGMSSDILSGISSDILSVISSDILSAISSDILSAISSDILSGKSIWHSIWHVFWHSIWHSIWHSLWHSIWLCLWPLRSGWGPARPTARRISQRSDPRRLRSGEAHSAQTLAGWGPARPTAIESWQWRSGEAHCDQELADEVQRGPLRSRAGRWGLARTTAIKSWQMRSGEEEGEGGERRRRRRRATNRKSNNPHLAGGEKLTVHHSSSSISSPGVRNGSARNVEVRSGALGSSWRFARRLCCQPSLNQLHGKRKSLIKGDNDPPVI